MALTAEQLQERQSGLGGSDAAAAIGASPWRTPFDLWLEKTRDPRFVPVEENERMRLGTLMEPVIADLAAARLDTEVVDPRATMRSQRHPFMVATPDRMLPQRRAGLELKNVGGLSSEWGEDGSDVVPTHYYLQCLHYMCVTQLPTWYLAALFFGNELRVYEINFNVQLAEQLVERERAFWSLVETRTPPSPTSLDDYRRAWTPQAKKACIADERVTDVLRQLQMAREMKAQVEERETELKAQVMEYMQDATVLCTPSGETLCTWSAVKGRETIDTKALRKDMPDVAERYTRVGEPSRSFRVK